MNARRLARALPLLLGAVPTACSSGGTVKTTPDGSTPHDAGPDAGGLTSLSVSGAMSALTPAFSPAIQDYYVRCAAGSNALKVTMTTAKGATFALTQPTTSPALASQTVAVSVPEGKAIVAALTEGGTTTDYWIRCLPHDFPPLAWSYYPEAGAPSPGYYLLGNAAVSPGESGYAMVLDVHGVPVWYQVAQPGAAVSNVESLANGSVSYVPTSFTTYFPYALVDVASDAITMLSPTGYQTDEHELQVLPNGHYLTFSYVLKPGIDLTGLSIPLPEDAGSVPLGPNSTIQDCTILEVDPSGQVVWTWAASDHFDPAVSSTYAQTGFGPSAILPDGGTSYDVFHCEAIDIDPANGNLLVSARGMSAVFYVDKATGSVLWKLGGTSASKDHATFVTMTDPFVEAHDGRLIAGWSPTCRGGTGQVSVFDDESTSNAPARAVIYDVVVGNADGGCDASAGDAGAPGVGTVAWQYKGTNNSGGAGSLRISAGDSRVIGWGIGIPALTEVTKGGEKLVELTFSSGDVSYRALKVPASTFDLSMLRESAGGQ